MTEQHDLIIDRAVDRFLGWELPKDFAPDNGISFKESLLHEAHGRPIGTNLFTAEQARAMFTHCLALMLSDLRRDLDQTMQSRDYAQEMADKLAAKIATEKGLDIGEHSNANCPWTNALNEENQED